MRKLADTGKPKICLTLTEATIAKNRSMAEREREWIDLVELRADHLAEGELAHLARFPEVVGLPSILSFRRPNDGGVRELTGPERARVLARALDGPWDFVELEEDLDAPEIGAKAAARNTSIIRTFHDLDGIPADLSSRIEKLSRNAREIPKATVTPKSTADLLGLLRSARGIGSSPAIVVGLGDWGFPSVVLPGRFSSAVTYCSAGGPRDAPGRVTPEVLRTVYRVGEVGPRARVFCVIGDPIHHSRSPWIHNPGLHTLGLDAVYIPIRVDRLSDFMQLADELQIGGASVTIPHKERVVALLESSDTSVAEVGACNTIVRSNGAWRGYNTDVEGFLVPLRSRVGDRLKGYRALVVGAGGAARAVVAGLSQSGCAVTIVNRTDERAEMLARQFGCAWVASDRIREERTYDVVVQATSVGMVPDEGHDPLPGYEFGGTEVVYDLIYAPPRTAFLKRAEEAGCTLIGGREMLLQQAYAQFKLFTGFEYPRDASSPPDGQGA